MAVPSSPLTDRARGGQHSQESAIGSRHISRFDRVQRAAHWANAVLFGVLMATALPLYFVQVDRFVGRRVLVVDIHTWSGVALPVPLIISLAGPWGERFRRERAALQPVDGGRGAVVVVTRNATYPRTRQVQPRPEARMPCSPQVPSWSCSGQGRS